ncbi:hypothetical protein GOBAR_DD28662 [Gossypium barbadense]|nr:hypothetical protein GOBAR_DD28662 [Gossypium barbadense]
MDVSPSIKRASELDTQFPLTKFHSQLIWRNFWRIRYLAGSVRSEGVLLILEVRRTQISDRIRKLQELVPNMDKVLKVHGNTLEKRCNSSSFGNGCLMLNCGMWLVLVSFPDGSDRA